MEISIIGLTPPPLIENIFLFLGVFDHFLRKSFENCILPPEMSNTCKKNLKIGTPLFP